MRVLGLASVFVLALAAAARAQSDPAPAWSGFYLGLDGGYGWSSAQSSSEFLQSAYPFSLSPVSPSTYHLDPSGFFGGPEAGFTYRLGNFVIGPEADISFGDASGSGSLSGIDIHGIPFTSLQSERLDWLATLRARVGYLPIPQLLVYVTGGLALGQVDATTTLAFNTGVTYAGARSTLAAGGTAGAGMEYSFAPNWSVKGEYLYYDLGTQTVVAPENFAGVFQTQSRFAVNGNIFRLGINYNFGPPPAPGAAGAGALPAFFHDIAYEVGTRYFWSTGTTRMSYPRGAPTVSKLTWSGLDANAGEAFGRVEHKTGLFLKGVVGAGSVGGGTLKDEDFPPTITPYSATSSNQGNGSLGYATVDLGWDLFALPNWPYPAERVLGARSVRFGPFVGYSYYRETLNAYGCAQTATNSGICGAPIPNTVLGITQDSRWNAMRAGFAGDMTFANRLKIGFDAAWLPFGSFNGTDTHWLRLGTPFVGDFNGPTPETGGMNGVQAELTIGYQLTDAISVAVGGRYWYFQSNATLQFEQSANPPGRFAPAPTDFRSDRFGGFIEASYRF